MKLQKDMALVVGKVVHEFDESGMLDDIMIGEDSLLSIMSHAQMNDGDEIEVLINIKRKK